MLIDRDKAIAVLTEHWSEMCRGGHPSQTMNLLADFCGAVDQDIRAIPASTRYAELERAARASLDVLIRCREVLDSLECECDSYHGYICPIHSDKASVGLTINSLRAALAALDKEAKPC